MFDTMDSQKFIADVERLFNYEASFTLDSARAAVPFLANRIDKLSNEPDGPLSIPPRVLVRVLMLQLLERARAFEGFGAAISEILSRIPRLSGRLFVIEIIGHRENVGRGLVSEGMASQLEKQILEEVYSTPVEDLAYECELTRICFLPRVLPRIEEDVGLGPRLVEHLHNESFLLGLLRSAVGDAFRNGQRERIFPWGELAETFGEALAEAVLRLDVSETTLPLSAEDVETIKLAKDYALGNVPPRWI